MIGSSPNEWKTLWEKEKLLVTSNFSFSHIVFQRLTLQTCKNQGLFGKELNSDMATMLSAGKGSRALTHYQTTNCRLFQTERVCRPQFQI